MIITGGCNAISLESKFDRGLELFEGHKIIDQLAKEDVHEWGNFCFVDYVSPQKTNELSEAQIAELLYLGHMFKPLHSPFFEPLHNRFAYLAHDDGWYCKLYCREISDFIPVICGKIKAEIKKHLLKKSVGEPSPNVEEHLLRLATDGLLIDLDEVAQKGDSVTVKLYTVGEYSNMDEILNNFERIKSNASKVCNLSCGDEWTMV
jgi:hypothetical protein